VLDLKEMEALLSPHHCPSRPCLLFFLLVTVSRGQHNSVVFSLGLMRFGHIVPKKRYVVNSVAMYESYTLQ